MIDLDYMLSPPEEQFDLLETCWPFDALGKPDDFEYQPRGGACQKMSFALGFLSGKDSLYAVDLNQTLSVSELTVNGVEISLPLAKESVATLLQQCRKSSKGERRWEVSGDQVKVNDDWSRKVERLGQLAAKLLGFESVPLNTELCRLVVYEPEGRWDRQQEEVQERDIAKLMVPLSTCAGDLVVYDDVDNEKQYRFKAGACVAYIADAEYAVEEVANGYRVALEYALRLEPDHQPLGARRASQFYLMEVKQGMEELSRDKEHFALLFTRDYSRSGIFKDNAVHVQPRFDRGLVRSCHEGQFLASRRQAVQFLHCRIRTLDVPCTRRLHRWRRSSPEQRVHPGSSKW